MSEKELKIVLLEDDASHARLIMEELHSAGFEFVPRVISTQQQLEEALEDFQPDLILSDFYLPDFDGLLALSICQGRCPDVPFVFVTGVLGEELAIETLKHGATDYVLKTHLSRLIPAVRRALQEANDRAYKNRLEKMLREEISRIEEGLRKDVAAALNEAISEIQEPQKAASVLESVRERIEGLVRSLQEIEQKLNQKR